MSAQKEPPAPQTYSVTETAAVLGISRAHCFNLAKTGQIPGVIRLGGRIVVSRSILDRAINETTETSDDAA